MTAMHDQSPDSQPGPDQPAASLPDPDAGKSNAMLIGDLQCELMTVQQGAYAGLSAWMSAFGGPTDIEFGVVGGDSSAGGGYRVSPDRLQDWITRLQAIIDKTAADQQYISRIKGMGAPALDSGSTMQAGRTRDSGVALQRSYDAWLDHANKQVASWKAALANYQNTEQATTDSMRKLAGQA